MISQGRLIKSAAISQSKIDGAGEKGQGKGARIKPVPAPLQISVLNRSRLIFQHGYEFYRFSEESLLRKCLVIGCRVNQCPHSKLSMPQGCHP